MTSMRSTRNTWFKDRRGDRVKAGTTLEFRFLHKHGSLTPAGSMTKVGEPGREMSGDIIGGRRMIRENGVTKGPIFQVPTFLGG